MRAVSDVSADNGRRYFPIKPWQRTARSTLGRAATAAAIRSWHYNGDAFKAMQGLATLLRGAAANA